MPSTGNFEKYLRDCTINTNRRACYRVVFNKFTNTQSNLFNYEVFFYLFKSYTFNKLIETGTRMTNH